MKHSTTNTLISPLSIHPGYCWTDIISTMDTERIRAEIPQGKLGKALDVANATLLLATDECHFMTGSELVMDGGQIAGCFNF